MNVNAFPPPILAGVGTVTPPQQKQEQQPETPSEQPVAQTTEQD